MRTYIGENPSVSLLLKEPGRTSGRVEIVRGKIQHLENPTDRALPDQFPCMPARFIQEALRIADHVPLADLFRLVPCLLQLIEGGEGALVGEVLLAGV